MKKISVLIVISLIMAGCGNNKQSGNESDSFITIDVTASYPQKELILQNFMDVEYITLETTDEFLNQGIVLDVGKELILVKNLIDDGDIFIYDRNGKGIRKINRRGQGPEEYTSIASIVLDESNIEIFITTGPETRKLLVYDLFGKFKRSISYRDGPLRYDKIYNYDNDNLICHNFYFLGAEEASNGLTHSIISKNDGSITKDIYMPVKEKKSTMLKIVQPNGGIITLSVQLLFYPIITYRNNWILTEYLSDTVYSYRPDDSMCPFIVRVPSIQSMNTEAFLFPGILSDHYYFMQILRKRHDESFTTSELVYDKQEKTIFECTVYNDDYSTKRTVSMTRATINDEIAFCQIIEAYELIKSLERGELKGKLKEIATGLDEDSNPVIMLVKYKK